MTSLDDILGKVRPPERTVELCLRGDLVVELERLEADLDSLEDDGSLAGTSTQARQIAEQIERLREEMRDATVTFKFRGLPYAEYSKLMKQHPPRKDTDDIDVNWATFPSAIIQACCVDPALDTDGVDKLADALTHAQWDRLFGAAYAVNRTTVDIPKSGRASAIMRSIGERSKLPEPGA